MCVVSEAADEDTSCKDFNKVTYEGGADGKKKSDILILEAQLVGPDEIVVPLLPNSRLGLKPGRFKYQLEEINFGGMTVVRHRSRPFSIVCPFNDCGSVPAITGKWLSDVTDFTGLACQANKLLKLARDVRYAWVAAQGVRSTAGSATAGQLFINVMVTGAQMAMSSFVEDQLMSVATKQAGELIKNKLGVENIKEPPGQGERADQQTDARDVGPAERDRLYSQQQKLNASQQQLIDLDSDSNDKKPDSKATCLARKGGAVLDFYCDKVQPILKTVANDPRRGRTDTNRRPSRQTGPGSCKRGSDSARTVR